MSRLLVVQNHRGGGPGRFGDWLVADGVALDVVHAYAGAPLPRRPEHDGVMVLGGGYLPDDDERAPWLAPTRALVAEALDRKVPVFGICLGGQLLARVAGGTVLGGHGEPEVGSTPLTLRPEAEADPLFRGLPERVTAVEQHVDAVTVLPRWTRWNSSGGPNSTSPRPRRSGARWPGASPRSSSGREARPAPSVPAPELQPAKAPRSVKAALANRSPISRCVAASGWMPSGRGRSAASASP